MSRQVNTNFSQQINFTGRLKENDRARFCILEKEQKTISNFSLHSSNIRK